MNAIRNHLKEYYDNLPGMEAVLVVSAAGMVFYPDSRHSDEMEDRNLLISTMLTAGYSLVPEHEMEYLLLKHLGGYIFARSVNQKAIIMVYAPDSLKLGLIMYDTMSLAKKLAVIFDDDWPDVILRTVGDDLAENIDNLISTFQENEELGFGKKI
ncbi:MAG: hypothetical protein INQ03_08135 [Candidatus Heimdallarchaeota archaeon]|nr:hypothetical protein [Candidatus Heimdallarchaeota archaeon]